MRYQKVILAVRIDPEITRYLENFLALLGNYELHEASRDLEAWKSTRGEARLDQAIRLLDGWIQQSIKRSAEPVDNFEDED